MSSVKEGDDAAVSLVVPIDVVSMCIGADDYEQATNGFAGATAVYSQAVQSGHAAFLGQNASRGFDDPPWDQLQVGAHLHWALPDGLTRGGGRGAELDFPATPNRWLVTRIAIDGAAPSARSWVVESDALSSAAPQDGSSVTLPVAVSSQFPGGFAYLGATHQIDGAGWSEALAAQGPSLASAAGTPLNAVSNGEAAFAAYYPSCRGVFGFWDPLDDVPATKADPARLAYVVTGWYADGALDPVQPGATAAKLEAARGWTFAPNAPAPTRSVYSGVVEGIAWSSEIAYVLGQDVQGPVQAQAAIGNTASEALAAYFTDVDHPDTALFESLLDAFQSGLINVFKQPAPGGLTQLEERLHDQRFAGMWSGSVYSIVSSAKDADPGELIDLPIPLADALNQLNALLREFEQCAFHADWFRWQLFTDWYRIFMIDPSEQSAAYALAQQRYGAWDALSGSRDRLDAAAHAQYVAVKAALGPGMELRKAPAERFVQPSDPSVVLAGPGLAFPSRYGSDGRFNDDGYLVCRTAGQVLTGVTVGETTLQASTLTTITAPAGVPDGAAITALLRESCLLNTALMHGLNGTPAAKLQAALTLALQGKAQSLYAFSGQPPSPVGVNWWEPNQWLPLFASWTVEFLPLAPTKASGTTVPYAPNVVTANFRLDQNAGGTLSYAPDGGPGSLSVDPRTAPFTQQYLGAGHLSSTPTTVLASVLADYLGDHTDATLSEILSQLTSGAEGYLVAPLNGLSDALTMKTQGLQLSVSVPTGSPDAPLTEAIAAVVGDATRQGGPDFDGDFNPLRAGWMKLSLTLVDAFGQQRAVDVPELLCADSMTTVVDGTPVPSVAYLEPRIAQASRLSFHWLAADGSGAEELTGNPAVTPVCGWLLPNHLNGALAIYDQGGRPLGTLFLQDPAGGRAPIGWQSAPGDASTIDQDLATVMEFQNPQLREFALAIGGPGATAEYFKALWHVLDAVADTIDPGSLQTDADLAVLVGRPVALVQAAVRLELRGAAMLDLGWDAVGTDTDAGLTGIEFPVVLGDLAKLRDGLIGYFKAPTAGGAYDLQTFYSQGADPQAKTGVVFPAPDTLCVTPTPPLDPDAANEPPDLTPLTQQVLMLMDPRAAVHATTGILPTESLTLPSQASQATESSLDLSFFTAPVLRGAGALTIPTPTETGYALSFIDQDHTDQGALEWIVDGDLAAPSANGVWAYSPQEIREGWMRLSPIAVGFDLLNAAGKPVVQSGQSNTLTLTIANLARRAITWRAGDPVAEGAPPPGSVFYVHFGTLVAQGSVGQITLSAPGWQFEAFTSPQYGTYWAAAPTADVTLQAGAHLTVAVEHVVPATSATQAQITFDYYAIDGIGDGVFADTLTVAASATPARA